MRHAPSYLLLLVVAVGFGGYVLLIAGGFAGCARRPSGVGRHDEFQPDKDTVLECKLLINQDRGGTFATVEFKNPTDHNEHVLKEVLLDEEPLAGPPFAITKDGKDIMYRGRFANKLPPTIDDADLLKPGESFIRTIRLE